MSWLRHRPRPLRAHLRDAAIFGVLALAALIAGHQLGTVFTSSTSRQIGAWGCAAGVLVFGVLATRESAQALSHIVTMRGSRGAATPVRVLVQIVGYVLTILGVLDAVNVNLTHLLAGGAITGVVIGIAAQQSLASFFAGLVLQASRPYVVGDRVTVYAGSVNGPHEGTVTDMRLIYTTVQTDRETLRLPNSVMLSAGIGTRRSGAEPAASPDKETPQRSPTDAQDSDVAAPESA